MCQQGLPLTPPGVMSEANSGMTLHSLVLSSDSFSCNCNSIKLSLVNWLLRAILTCLIPLLRVYINQYFSMHLHFQFVQQCIQISTRINSSNVHTYIFVCFIRNTSNNSTWCQNRGCSYISSRRRIYRSNPSILNISTVELQFY